MSITTDDVSSNLGLEISAGRRPVRRKQAKRAKRDFSLRPPTGLNVLLQRAQEVTARIRSRGLSLELPEYTVSFSSPAEFEFALSSRTDFPVRKLNIMMRRSTEDLRIMASNIRQVEKHFAEVLAQSLHQPERITELLRGIEIRLFSRDHQWRDIAAALNGLGPAYDVYKRVALVKYMQYLGCRQDMLRNLYLDRVQTELRVGLDSGESDEHPVGISEDAGPIAGAIRLPTQLPEHPSASHRDTTIFALERIHLQGDAEGFGSLPRGETVEVTVEAGESLEMLLPSYRLKLHPGQRYRLTDEDGNIHVLPTGKSVIGRDRSADIALDGENRLMSRKHLMIEPVSANRVKLTDLSSHGSSIPLKFFHAPS